ncbi:RidA family protein [Salmonella enterica subsp. enterica]|uniref:Regulator n=1 Tax=Citrobacter braakii TaxID=57706 RepID=A0A1V8NS47_CITBR|nr:RidA family protein [Citrobacter braakii]EBW7152257.1 RidA family protein [Salmonella enterica subsp. enterica serovar Coeln]EDV0070015.1 RidA family protein [Salmonella enterica subsp. enterica serovar Litchfield]EDV1959986.1 RidA family protein [Salmonella enterica subsp. enterica serovar Litchfield]OQM39246.1 regulator [Citrobacter braakii]QXC16705.1 RidA family protein [Citrobacter braakii]
MIIRTQHAPEAIGPYSQAILSGNLLFISGCCPFSPTDGSVHGLTIEEQTQQAMSNLQAIVEGAGLNMKDVVKTTCFISDLNHFQSFNAIYSTYFSSGAFPARSCVEVARLPKDVLIEVEAIAVVKQ